MKRHLLSDVPVGLLLSGGQVGYLAWAQDLAHWPRLPADYVAREVIEGSDLPVLTVRGGELDAHPRLARVLVPVDFSPATREALDLAAEIVRNVDGEVILLHVLPEPSHGSLPARWAPSTSNE